MSNIPYNYKKYLDDVTKMRQRGTISSGEQIASPSSAGSRGLAKLTQFTNSANEFMKANINESATREYQNLPKDKIEELEEQNEILEELSGFYAAVLERLGIDADDLADDARSKGQIKRPSEFVNSEDFNEYIEVIERSLF